MTEKNRNISIGVGALLAISGLLVFLSMRAIRLQLDAVYDEIDWDYIPPKS